MKQQHDPRYSYMMWLLFCSFCCCLFCFSPATSGASALKASAGDAIVRESMSDQRYYGAVASQFNLALRPQRPYGLLGTGSLRRPPRLSHSS